MAAVIMSGLGSCDQQWMPVAAPALSLQKKKKIAPCRASCASKQHRGYGYDLYELLGVERSASQQEIRRSYRWLQKRCHPDVAGSVGHDMSILLNQAYATLADPNERAAYDQSLADSVELDGYTGFPLYSKWFGPAHESRAVFVDESHCVGCLKCALIAPNTFAIENRFGRARAVGQWADPRPVIKDAIKACPVDCITWVDRSQLAAFEFVMSKEPRSPVGIEVHSNGGVKTTNVFKTVERLLEKLKQQEERNTSNLRETPAQRKARLAAMEGVQARAGKWWYHFIGKSGSNHQAASDIRREAYGAIVPLIYYRAVRNTQDSGPYSSHNGGDGHDGYNFTLQGELHRLFEATSKRWHGHSSPGGGHALDDEYWVPITRNSCPVTYSVENHPHLLAQNTGLKKGKGTVRTRFVSEKKLTGWAHDVISGVPVWTSGIAAWYVGITGGPGTALSDTEVGLGPVPTEWMHSMEMQIVLVAAIWYLIGSALANASVLAVKSLRVRNDDSDPPCA